MLIFISVLVALAGICLVIFGLGYSGAFFAGRKLFERALASSATDMGKSAIDLALGKIKSDFVRKRVAAPLVSVAADKAISIARDQISAGVRRGFLIAGFGVLVFIAAFFLPGWLRPYWS